MALGSNCLAISACVGVTRGFVFYQHIAERGCWGLFDFFDAAQYLSLIAFASLVNDIQNIERSRNVAKPNVVLRVPLKDGTA